MLSLKNFADQVIQNTSKRTPSTGKESFGLVGGAKGPLADPRASRQFSGWLSKQHQSAEPVMPSRTVVGAITKRAMGGNVNPSKVTEVGEDGPELLVNHTVVPLNAKDRAKGQKKGDLPKGSLDALLKRIRHREDGGDVPANDVPTDRFSQPDSYSPNQPDVQETPPDAPPQSAPQQMPSQPAQEQPDAPDTGDIYSQIANDYANKIASLSNKNYGPKHHGGFGDILKGAGIGALQGLAKADPRMGLGAELGAAVGGAGAGGVGGGIDSSNPQRTIDQMRLQKLQGDAAVNQKLGLGQAQLEDVQSKPADRAAATQAKIDALAEKKREADNRQQSVNRQRFVKSHGGRFDPAAATEADKKELATFGETPESIGKFDINKPDVRTVAGKTFQWNGKTWDEAGLPTDGSKQIVDVTVTDPDTKIQHTYSTTSDHAAGLQSALQRAGMTIDAAAARQKSQQTFQAGQNAQKQNFQAGENQKNRDFRAEATTARQQLGDVAAKQRYTASFMRTHPHASSQDLNDFLGTLGFQ